MFITPYNFCDVEKEKKLVDETCIVETAGYQPKEKLINLKNELLFYTCDDIDIKLPKRKIKSL